jgi:MFS family permease
VDVKLATTQTIKSSGRLKTLDSLKVPEFRLLLGAQAWGWLGMGMIMIANPLLLYRLSGSALLVGVMSLASCIPVLLLSLFGGTIADRIQKKYILVGSRSGMVITWLIIALALSLGYLSKNNSGSWWILIFCAALNGILMALANPATVAIIPELIGQDRVMNGLALNNLGMNIFGFIGPALTGFLVDARGFSVVYFLMAGLLCVSAIAMIFLPRGTSANITNTRSTIGDILESFKYISRETVFLTIIILLIFHMLGSTGYNKLTAVFTESILKVSATKLGILGSVASLAAILGSFILASLPLKNAACFFYSVIFS